MNNKVIMAILAIIIIGVSIFMFLGKKDKEDKEKNEEYTVSKLSELFPSKEMKQTYKDSNGKYEVNVKSINEKDGVTTVITEYETETDGKETTVKTTYEITNEKVVESAEYIEKDSVVSIIYPMELIVGIPYKNMIWKSKDGLITNTVVSMKNNQVTIESIRKMDVYEENKTTPTSKDFKETRVYEKGKGIVLYRSEIVGDKSSIYEKKIVK